MLLEVAYEVTNSPEEGVSEFYQSKEAAEYVSAKINTDHYLGLCGYNSEVREVRGKIFLHECTDNEFEW